MSDDAFTPYGTGEVVTELDLNEYAYVAEAPLFHYEPSRAFLRGVEPRPARMIFLRPARS